MKPTLVIDSREQTPLKFTNLQTVAGTLYAGDYGIQGSLFRHRFAVERKSADDLVQSLTRDRERFERELLRLRSYDFRRVLIECNEETIINQRYRSKASPKAVMHSIYAFEIRYDVQFIFAGTRERAARLIERWATYYWREQMKMAEYMTKNTRAV